MSPPRKVHMVGLKKRAHLSRIPVFKSWLKEERLVVKERPEREGENAKSRGKRMCG